MRSLHGLGGVAHVLQHFCVGVSVLQRLPLELDGGQRPVDLSQLLLVALFPLQGLQSRCTETNGVTEERVFLLRLHFILEVN